MNYKKFSIPVVGWMDGQGPLMTSCSLSFAHRLTLPHHKNRLYNLKRPKGRQIKKDKLQIDTLIRQTRTSFGHLVRSAFLWKRKKKQKKKKKTRVHLVTGKGLHIQSGTPSTAPSFFEQANLLAIFSFFSFQTNSACREINTMNFSGYYYATTAEKQQ